MKSYFNFYKFDCKISNSKKRYSIGFKKTPLKTSIDKDWSVKKLTYWVVSKALLMKAISWQLIYYLNRMGIVYNTCAKEKYMIW